jgi:hypothetical protein
MVLDLVREDGQRGGDEACRAVGVAARAATRELSEPALELGANVAAPGTRKLRECSGDRRQAVDARPHWPALSPAR